MIHSTAQIDEGVILGEGVQVWQFAHVRAGAVIGDGCILGRGAYVDAGVTLGKNCKVQNYACLYGPAILGAGVFIGPHAVLTNDKHPRAVNPDMSLKTPEDWERTTIKVHRGASIGAGAIVLPGVEIGEWAMVGAGAVVTESVPNHGVAVGSPAKMVGYVNEDGRRKSWVVSCPGCFDPYCTGSRISYQPPAQSCDFLFSTVRFTPSRPAEEGC